VMKKSDTMARWIEYHVNNENNDGDVGVYEGRQWRAALRKAKECEEGLHPHIEYISKVFYYEDSLNGCDILDEFFIYQRDKKR